MFSAALHRSSGDVRQVGDLSGEDVEGLVQVAVGGLEADGVVVGQVGDCGALAHETQQQDRLSEAPQRPPAPAGADPGAMSEQQSSDGLGEIA